MAESLGAKNYEWDKADGYKVPNDENLYNSYFYDAHDNTSVLEKFNMQGKRFTDTLDGGVALHCNLEDNLSMPQYLKLIDYAIEQGCNYFTFNIPNTQCDKCGKIFKQPLTECPNCKSTSMTQWTRIIGYLRPIKAFSKPRQIEQKKRTYTKKQDSVKL